MVNQTIRLIDKSELENVLLSQLTLSPRVTRTVRLAVCVDVAHLKRDFSRSRPLCDLLQSLHKASR
ncbi:hypothetical protein T4C_4613 [Trichinella pseudospiralis]|uniref:Uncharacterized protein n=1 Tax=Trichinella pseudospiralis TaxID=6337 RepID=A0A0V1JS04_TRIPS|nr:hypothetical protein T4C_4613 [Trichinella pseudospiralis]